MLAMLAKSAIGAAKGNLPGFAVKVARGWYGLSAGVIIFATYTGWRNQRVEEGSGKFPIPGWDKLPVINEASRDIKPSERGAFTGPVATRLPYDSPKSATVNEFLRLLMSQRGDKYVFGGETSGEKNPNGYDCSEFIQWAMVRMGYKNFPDGSANQYAHCIKIDVKDAIKTPGALLYRVGHIAVSLGNGQTIEARGTDYGVGVFSALNRFTAGAMIPEFRRDKARSSGPRKPFRE